MALANGESKEKLFQNIPNSKAKIIERSITGQNDHKLLWLITHTENIHAHACATCKQLWRGTDAISGINCYFYLRVDVPSLIKAKNLTKNAIGILVPTNF